MKKRHLLLATASIVVGAVALTACHDTIAPTKNLAGGATGCVQWYSPAVRPCRTDGGKWTVHNAIGGPVTKAQTEATLTNQYAATRLDYKPVSTYVTSGSDQTDLHIEGAALDPGSSGIYKCAKVNATTCDRGVVEIDATQLCFLMSYYEGVTCEQKPTALQSNSCHEIGHSVGLVHGQEADPKVWQGHPHMGCMQTEIPFSQSYVTLGTDNRNGINDIY